MTALYLVLSALFVGSLALLAHTYAVLSVADAPRRPEPPVAGDRFEKESEFPEVAVLMAVYNEEKVIEETLASILSSTTRRTS